MKHQFGTGQMLFAALQPPVDVILSSFFWEVSQFALYSSSALRCSSLSWCVRVSRFFSLLRTGRPAETWSSAPLGGLNVVVFLIRCRSGHPVLGLKEDSAEFDFESMVTSLSQKESGQIVREESQEVSFEALREKRLRLPCVGVAGQECAVRCVWTVLAKRLMDS